MKYARGAAPANRRTIGRVTFFMHPPSDAEFPAEVAEKFDDGQPWLKAANELSAV